MSAKKSPSVSDLAPSRVSQTLTEAVSKKLSAFTLVELVVVITILAVLATIGFLALSGYSQDAKDAAVKANVRSVATAVSSESAVTNNSPRYYVVHDDAASLTGAAVAYVDGAPVTLTGGQYGADGTNYSAGNPDWAKLKLNPEKFRLSSLGARFAAAFGTAEAAYDSKAVSIGAVDAALAPTASGRNRSASFFQVTGTAPATGLVSVAGNFPAPTAAQVASGAVLGLVKSPVGTGALVDGDSAGTSGGGSSGGGTPAPAFVAGTAYAAGQAFTYALPDSGETVTVTVQGTGVGIASSVADASCTEGGVPAKDIAIWGSSGNPQIWSACNKGATNPIPYANMKFDGSTNDVDVSTAQYSGGIYQWGNNADVRSAGTWSNTANTNDDAWGNTTNTNATRQ